jgi:rhodanese-related sulfurtransferase
VLPEYKGTAISADDLVKKLQQAETSNCIDSNGAAMITLLDFRNLGAQKQKTGGDRYRIKTSCPTLTFHLDDLINNAPLRSSIPKKQIVVSISETGNRDLFLQRYLSGFGYTNILSLEYGMRAWLKAGYPSENLSPPPELPEQRSE